ncbi:MAG: amidohydrolase [Actinomycetota bacterium]|nr:amidohydrolase [Actinomycetota bacterium]
MSTTSTLAYPSGGLGAPKDRSPGTPVELGLPAGFEVFSADDHISLADDIWFEGFPEHLRDQAPRVMQVEDGWVLGSDGSTFLPQAFIDVLNQYDPVPGSHSGDIDARLRALDAEGVTGELAFPNALLALLMWPDKEIRELCFRIYNQYLADVQERSGGRIWGVGLINWWDADGAARTLDELKELGLRTFLMPLNPGKGDDGRPIDYASTAMRGVWDAIEASGVPVSHHIGENTPGIPSQVNTVGVGMLQSVAPFREVFAKYILGGILDRHPGLRIGWFEGGINWVPAAIQDAEHIAASFSHLNDHELAHPVQHYWDTHMTASFMVDPLGLEMIDRIGVTRAMWSSDFPHNESTYGYTPEVLASVVAQVGPEAAQAILGDNIRDFLGLSGHGTAR